MRKQFTMTDDQLNTLLEACRPVPYMIVGGVAPRSQQENANAAWEALGKEMGFDHMSVQPVQGAVMSVFTAEVNAVE